MEGKKGVKLARFDLIPVMPLWRLAEVYGRGALKYADRNWERGIRFSRLFGAMMRHAAKYWAGEQYDPEDGQHHLASVAWMAFALMELEETHPELDDRPRARELDSELLNPEEIAEAKQEVETTHMAHPDDLGLLASLEEKESLDPGDPTSPELELVNKDLDAWEDNNGAG